MIKLNKNIKKDIRAHSLEEYPNECCGLIIEDGREQQSSHRCLNVSEQKDKHFEIDAKSYIKASKLGLVKGYYHSHADNNDDFTETDKTSSEAHELPLVMYFLKEDKFFIHRP